MKNIYYYQTIQNATDCEHKSDVYRNSVIRSLSRSFEKSIDVESFYVWELNELKNQKVRFQVTKESFSAANGFTIEGTCLLNNPVLMGDVLYNKNRDEYFICTQSYKPSRTHYKCVLTRCNNFLKWQDRQGNIYNYPVFDMNSTQYNSGVSGDRITTIGSSQHLLTITGDENTIILNHDKRFFLDRNVEKPSVFKLTQNDTTAYNYDKKGVLKITVTEEQYNCETDSIENWLCDYIAPKELNEIKILFNGKPTIRVGGQKTFSVESESAVTWSVKSSNFDVSRLNLEYSDNKVIVHCEYDELFLDNKSFSLSCVDADNNTGEIEIKLTGGV